MGTAHNNVLAAPRELLYIGTVIRQRNRAAVVALLAILNVSETVEILIGLGQLIVVLDEITEGNRIAIISAFCLQRILFHLGTERMNGATPEVEEEALSELYMKLKTLVSPIVIHLYPIFAATHGKHAAQSLAPSKGCSHRIVGAIPTRILHQCQGDA